MKILSVVLRIVLDDIFASYFCVIDWDLHCQTEFKKRLRQDITLSTHHFECKYLMRYKERISFMKNEIGDGQMKAVFQSMS